MRSTQIKSMRFKRRIATLMALVALMSSIILPAQPSQMSAHANSANALGAVGAAPTDPAAAQTRAQEAYGKMPIQFEANQGQTDARVNFITHASGATVFLTATEAVFVLSAPDETATRAAVESPEGLSQREVAPTRRKKHALRMKIEGASSAPQVEGLDKLPGIVNYLTGNDPANWHTDIPTFGRVHYAGVYEGVNLVYYGNQQQLEYDFVVAPGADYNQIALNFEGANALTVDAGGDLLIETSLGTIRQHRPSVYQEVNGERREIGSAYSLTGAGRVGFAVGEYDAQRPLIIDPVLAYSTYLGGNSFNSGRAIAVDAVGNAYVTGDNNSNDFPTTSGAFDTTNNSGLDAFVTKLNTTGTGRFYSTYLGGSGSDTGSAIAVDSAGNAYVAGHNDTSPNFPTTPDAFDTTQNPDDDAFVTKFSTTGTALVYSTYLGGSGFDDSNGIAVDSARNIYVTGFTDSVNFPTTPDAFQTLNVQRSAAYITKIGDYSVSGRVIDSSGNGIAGVTVTLSGSNSAITTTDAGGYFSFLNTTLGGSYTVTSFKSGFTFAPESISTSNFAANQELLFIGSSNTPTPTPTPTPVPTPGQTLVKFEFDQYIAAEDCGGLDIAVTRTGDTTGALTVDFATADGAARQKSDYGMMLGTLNFAPGETRKTVTLLITEDAFNEGDESFTLNLFNLVGTGTLAEPGRATIIIADDDPSGTTVNPIDDTQVFVCQHYHDFLNREPDAAGLLFWTNNIESCGANASCREARRIDTSAAFFLSIEFQTTGFYAIRLQRTAFGKRSDMAATRMAYQDLVRDTRQLGEGVIVGQAGADARIEQNKQAYATQVVTSAQFVARFPTSQTAAQYVDALYASAQVTPTASERTDALTAFGGGGTAGRVAALRKVGESQAIVNAELNPAFVLLQYHGYLRRNPTDLPDTNDTGYQFWLAKLNEFSGDHRKAELVKAFLVSMEYRSRFGQP